MDFTFANEQQMFRGWIDKGRSSFILSLKWGGIFTGKGRYGDRYFFLDRSIIALLYIKQMHVKI